ncbi:hypothetical protein [Fluviicola sp.]|uniref:hypothetical protein n=1 Tax=Fluviicola sp. TaxID=1917219 RepID=UPI003D26A4A9
MKTAILIPVCFISTFSFGQSNPDKLVVEVSPINGSINSTLAYNLQGKISYLFNKHLSIAARHNQGIVDIFSVGEKTSPNVNKKSSLSDIAFGITLINTQKPIADPTEEARPSWIHKLLQLDLGMTYYKFAAIRTDYYSYDLDNQGNYKVINSINRLSASLGFSFILRENNIKNPNNIKLKRQHTFSAGAYYGLNYDLQGYVKIPGENPTLRAPKDYKFSRGGYYFRYNFRQQINKHLFLGADLFFSKMPYVEYRSNDDLFLFRGGESEFGFQPYTGITVGWAF